MRRHTASQGRDESGQMAFLMILTLPVLFIFLSLSVDVGAWFLDHRTAQNQADAAVLAAVQFLPDADTNEATAAVYTWLEKNGSGPDDLACLEYSDLHPAIGPDGKFDSVRVCIERESPLIFSQFLDIPFVEVGATAAARIGPAASITNVMPWALAPPDPTCDGAGQECFTDLDGDGDLESCGYYPPVPLGGELCPWGLNENVLRVLKFNSGVAPGNFAAIKACGNGVSDYRACVEGTIPTDGFSVGETVYVETEPGNLGGNTNEALENRLDAEGGDGTWECDIDAMPDPITGMDPDGRAAAWAKFADPATMTAGCDFRLVTVPLIDEFPDGGAGDVVVLGVATFAIAGWDRQPPWGESVGTTTKPCGQSGGVGFECGMVWGYLMGGVWPPTMLADQISNANVPYAPLLIALVE